jgi:hypothetical protein
MGFMVDHKVPIEEKFIPHRKYPPYYVPITSAGTAEDFISSPCHRSLEIGDKMWPDVLSKGFLVSKKNGAAKN